MANRANVHHETSDVDVRGIRRVGIGLLAAGAIIPVLVWLLFLVLASHQTRPDTPDNPLAAQQNNRLPPEPRLQTNPRQDLLDYRAQQDTTLHNYGWIDRSGGIVRIPIDQAMKLTVQRGLPVREGNK